MEAGKDLDVLIAEKVMGLKGPFAKPPFNVNIYGPCDNNGNPVTPLPDYSTSIADAWEVVERVNTGKRLWFSVSRSKNGRPNVCIDFNDEDVIEGDSVPHAICLAALEALRAVGA